MRRQNATSASPAAARTSWSAIGTRERHQRSSPSSAMTSTRSRMRLQSAGVPVSVIAGMPHVNVIQYEKYWMTFTCGIPAITLTGTPADWRRIRERVDVIAELGLERWCRSLVPIADQLVRAAAGDADVAFWRRIYNPID